MVRTRASRNTKADSEDVVSSTSSALKDIVKNLTEEEARMFLESFNKEFDTRILKLEDKLQSELASLDRGLQMCLSTMTEEELNYVPGSKAPAAAPKGRVTSSVSSSKRPITSTAMKTMPAKFDFEEEEEEEEESQPTTCTRQSRARTRTVTSTVTKAPPTRDLSQDSAQTSGYQTRSRSRSCSRNITLNSTYNLYQTPVTKNRPGPTTPITPKVNPYGPITFTRLPRGGEVSISVDGSPLMAPSSSREPNITVPVNDAVYCIMPSEGPVPNFAIDDETREKLQKLRENLNSILND